MNLLLENGLPEEIDGRPIYPDFRNMIRLEQILKDEKIPAALKLACGLRQLFAEVPEDTEYALQKLLWFYSCGRMEEEETPGAARSSGAAGAGNFRTAGALGAGAAGTAGVSGAAGAGKRARKHARKLQRAYDFDEDDALIYASFRMAYGVRLAEVEYLHWWEFSALLQSLPDTTPMGRVMYLRTVELDTIPDKEQRRRIAEQKEYWKLPPLQAAHAGRGLQEMQQAARARARQRLAQARREQAQWE